MLTRTLAAERLDLLRLKTVGLVVSVEQSHGSLRNWRVT